MGEAGGTGRGNTGPSERPPGFPASGVSVPGAWKEDVPVGTFTEVRVF